ncbi:hypothetical protein [Veillonella nakazawae]|uniref:hypothetical protein n=1 Tax=Veillonella nakazawae TaxID=2682456 RepID=UPI00399672B3
MIVVYLPTIEAVRKENFDLYVDLHGVFQSALFEVFQYRNVLEEVVKLIKDGASLFILI